jgi:ribokinase
VDVFVIGSFIVAASTKLARFPAPGESLAADNLTLEPGGKGFNLALGLHRLGVSVDGVMAVGSDVFAAFAAEALESAGLPASMLRQVGGQTGAGIGFSTTDGDNCLAIFSGANTLLAAEDVLAHEALAGARFVLAQFETGDAAISAGFRAARARGAQTLLNPSPYRPIAPDILAATTVLIMNETEAELCGKDLGAAADDHAWLATRLFAHGIETVIVTLGENGVTAYQKGQPVIHRPALRVEAIDPLGAGDAFTAGFVSGLVGGDSVQASLDRGNICGAFCVGRRGVYDALPTNRDLFG